MVREVSHLQCEGQYVPLAVGQYGRASDRRHVVADPFEDQPDVAFDGVFPEDRERPAVGQPDTDRPGGSVVSPVQRDAVSSHATVSVSARSDDWSPIVAVTSLVLAGYLAVRGGEVYTRT